MSRIHDALKKAEQERADAARQGLATPDAEAASLPVFHRDTLPAAGAPVPAVFPGRSAGPVEAPLAFTELVARCTLRDWKLESKIAQMVAGQNQAAGNEELRTLRSRLYQIRDRRPLRTVLVTSALPAEGKTFLTVGLAHVIVRQHERRALLIDADLRRSHVHQILGAPSAPGLTDYLSGAADELAVVQRGPNENLFFIPGGQPVSNHAELLGNGRLKTLLERLGPLFDWVLIDSPPAVPVSDASLMAAFCDGVLLVVRAAATPFDLVQRARDEFRNRGLLGVVLNQVEQGQTYHSYYYDYASQPQKA